MNIEEKIIISFVLIASLITLGLISVSPPTSLQIAVTCPDGICGPGESPLTCPQDCGGGPALPSCSNGICEPFLGEDANNCPSDCGAGVPDGGSGGVDGGGIVPPGGGEEQPPPSDPTDFPPEIPPPEEGETIDLPPEGVSIPLEEGVTLGLFPLKNFKATIFNLTKIDPGAYRLLLCNQTSVASWEINVSVDLAYLCVDYSKYDIEEPTLTVYKFIEGIWKPLPPSKIILNIGKKIICGNITSTPYLVSGFSQTPNSRTALVAIIDANNSIYSARNQGMDVSIPLSVLDSAWSAYYICEFTLAKNLADRAKELLVSLPFSAVLIISTIIAAIWYNYYRVKMRVKLKTKAVKRK